MLWLAPLERAVPQLCSCLDVYFFLNTSQYLPHTEWMADRNEEANPL